MAQPGRPHARRQRIALETGVTLACRSSGDPAGPSLVLIHAWGESSASFDRLVPGLADRCSMVAPDLRGHGDSEASVQGYSLSQVSEDVVALMDQLHLGDVVLVGSSSGGYVAQQIAVSHQQRVRGLVLVGAPRSLAGRPSFYDEVAHLTDPVSPEWVKESMTWFPVFHPVPEWYLQDRITDGTRITASVWVQALAGLCDATPPTETGRITAPTLILWGQRDGLLPHEDQVQLRDAIADARLIEYPDTGHLVLWEEPEQVAADVTRFLNDLDRLG